MSRRRGPGSGQGTGKIKLSDNVVLEIRAYCQKHGDSHAIHKELAEKYEVSWRCIYSITHGFTRAYLVPTKEPMQQTVIGKRYTSWRVLGPKER